MEYIAKTNLEDTVKNEEFKNNIASDFIVGAALSRQQRSGGH